VLGWERRRRLTALSAQLCPAVTASRRPLDDPFFRTEGGVKDRFATAFGGAPLGASLTASPARKFCSQEIDGGVRRARRWRRAAESLSTNAVEVCLDGARGPKPPSATSPAHRSQCSLPSRQHAVRGARRPVNERCLRQHCGRERRHQPRRRLIALSAALPSRHR
jgi:hypothetical protein